MRALAPIRVRERPKWARVTTKSLYVALIMFVVGFIALPTVMVFPLSITSADVLTFPPQGFSWHHFEKVLSDAGWRNAFITSIQVALMAGGISGVLGTTIAAVIPREGQLRLWIELGVALPLVIPPVVLAITWYTPFSGAGVIYTPLGVAIAHAFYGLPFVYLNVAAALASLNPQLGLAARSMGAGPFTVFTRITLPIVMPGVVAGVLLTIVLSIDELILAVFLGGGAVGTIPVTMWSAIQYVMSPDIAAVAAVMTLITIAGVCIAFLGLWITGRRKKRTA